MAILEDIQKILHEKLDINPADVSADKNFVDLNIDSLDLYELVYEVESEFGVSIPDEEATNLQKVGDLISFIEKAKS